MRPHLRVAGAAGNEGLIPTTDRFGVALGDFVRCHECGHAQLDPMPSEQRLDEAYRDAASDDYEAEERGQRATAAAELARIERHVEPGALVDLGCWVGFFVDEAARRGWRTVGVEPSVWAAGRARERGAEVVVASLLEADLPEGAFAAVTMADVIEHLPAPGAALDRVAALLSPDGVVWLATPDAGSRLARAMGRRWWSVIPTHVHLFTRRSITRLLERHGFEVVEIGTSPKTFSVRYYLGRLGGYWPPLARALVWIARRLKLADRLWSPDFGDRMAVVARIAR
jgi:2-polyprenyl-3-methyl-5-hydroxy-6-metoxy-1,4-benzoquinol methylase